MTDTPETDNCIKEYKHIRFLEEDHWSLNGKFTYTHPIVALCRKLERKRDGLKSAGDCASDLLDTAIAERDLWKLEATRWRDMYIEYDELLENQVKEAVNKLTIIWEDLDTLKKKVQDDTTGY